MEDPELDAKHNHDKVKKDKKGKKLKDGQNDPEDVEEAKKEYEAVKKEVEKAKKEKEIAENQKVTRTDIERENVKKDFIPPELR